MNVAELVNAVAELTWEERVEFMSLLHQRICRFCNEPHPTGIECKCWSDD